MSRWIDASDADRQQSAYIIATEKNISERIPAPSA